MDDDVTNKIAGGEGGAEKKPKMAQNGEEKRILTLRAHTFFLLQYVYRWDVRGGGAHPLSISSSRHSMKLKYVPRIPLVKWWQLMTSLAGSCGCRVTCRPETEFRWPYQKWKTRHQSSSFIMKTNFGKFQGHRCL